MNRFKEMLKHNRVFRTFVQTFAGYILTNIAYAADQVTSGTGEPWYKVMLVTLLIPALSTALAVIMNSGKNEE